MNYYPLWGVQRGSDWVGVRSDKQSLMTLLWKRSYRRQWVSILALFRLQSDYMILCVYWVSLTYWSNFILTLKRWIFLFGNSDANWIYGKGGGNEGWNWNDNCWLLNFGMQEMTYRIFWMYCNWKYKVMLFQINAM